MSQPAVVNPSLQAIRDQLKASLQERSALVDGMIVALLAKEPLFVLGPPGTAKSLVCTALCNAIKGNYFSHLMTKFTVPEELFGPWSLKGLQEDRYKRITTGKLPECHIAFLDEVFKPSSAILNTLLTAINERTINNDGVQQIPLQTLFGASNEVPTSEELGAFYDRFVLRYTVDTLKDSDNFKTMFDSDIDFSNMPSLPLEELMEIQAHVRTIPVDAGASAKVVELRSAIADKGMFVSDRKWKQAKNVVRAWAYLEGHAAVETEDLVILENVLWQSPEQIPEVRAVVRKLCNPIAEVVQRHLDASNDVMIQWKKEKINAMEAFQKLQQSKKAMDEIYAKTPRDFVQRASKQIGDQCKVMATTLFDPAATK